MARNAKIIEEKNEDTKSNEPVRQKRTKRRKVEGEVTQAKDIDRSQWQTKMPIGNVAVPDEESLLQ